MLCKVSNNIKTIACEFSICKIDKERYNNVNNFETLNQMMFVLFNETEISEY